MDGLTQISAFSWARTPYSERHLGTTFTIIMAETTEVTGETHHQFRYTLQERGNDILLYAAMVTSRLMRWHSRCRSFGEMVDRDGIQWTASQAHSLKA
ncbi:hypothetical protein An12g03820 [Aspergillus niger]|uniref:Uncharacterized protein n=2 Tax=Aspergillus niger TaxID=5061 RepID=A2QZ68_ASPNC|nr:hypothetical protein An12g03820 [Aspergillus niger]CAK46153.1 hypothetical protein An12g03820 [Aspergillus niger]